MTMAKQQQGPVRVAIIGLGGRGKNTYAKCSLRFPEKMKIVAVADPIEEKREEVRREYGIDEALCFSTAEELLAKERLADVLFVCTQDRMHYEHAMAALNKGYHVLLEKPISPDPVQCAAIAALAKKKERHVQVCHVLRYTPFFKKIKELLEAGTIGDVVSIQAIENVEYWHQAHSFVRGNWRNSDTSSPMILAKSCHDMDILLWLADKKSRYVSSFGDLYLFKKEKAPKGAGLRCLKEECAIKEQCPYDAEKIYLTNKRTGLLQGKKWWPVNILNNTPTEENIREAIRTGDYGRCVYHCDNNVVDHQVVNLMLEDGVTVSFTMCAFTSRGGRHLKIMGTLGDIEGDLDDNTIRIGVFGKEPEMIDVKTIASDFSGHGGGDFRMIEELLDDILSGKKPGSGKTSIDKSVESHYVAFAAEESRLNHGASISMDEWTDRLNQMASDQV